MVPVKNLKYNEKKDSGYYERTRTTSILNREELNNRTSPKTNARYCSTVFNLLLTFIIQTSGHPASC